MPCALPRGVLRPSPPAQRGRLFDYLNHAGPRPLGNAVTFDYTAFHLATALPDLGLKGPTGRVDGVCNGWTGRHLSRSWIMCDSSAPECSKTSSHGEPSRTHPNSGGGRRRWKLMSRNKPQPDERQSQAIVSWTYQWLDAVDRQAYRVFTAPKTGAGQVEILLFCRGTSRCRAHPRCTARRGVGLS